MGTSSNTESQAARSEHRFGCTPPLTMGVEEELLLVDPDCGLVADAEKVMEEIDPDHRKAVSTEIFATQIEMKTGVCMDAGQAVRELTDVRRAIVATGARLMGSGLYPG
ncbi:MAG TPA: glutamate-cysteine ligase family protein, partial [Solirubrobacterales bacterium]|nr:glutamate-cysteine ligase family protein [Solirubrobacterales bacterium]